MKKGSIKADELNLDKKAKDGQKKAKKTKGLDSSEGIAGEHRDDQANDSFEKYYNKELDLDEDQVPIVIFELNESAINFITQEQFEKALILLQKCQTMLEQIQADLNPHDKFVYLLVSHNMALCYQKLGVLDECAMILEQCIKFIESEAIQQFFNDENQPSLRLKLLKYKCKTHMQICALFSQVHKHREAALHANEAIQISHFFIHDAESLCSFYTKELIQKKPLAEVSIIGNLNFSLMQKTAVKMLPILQAIIKKMALEDDCKEGEECGVPMTGPLPKNHHSLQKKIDQKTAIKLAQEKANARLGSGSINIDVGEADMKNILGYLNQNEWVFSLNIGNIMQISPLTLQDFMSCNGLVIELSREFILEKICFLCVSYFCIGTEFRFLHQQNEIISGISFQRKDSEYWHGKAVELSISFLPSESPLVSHILMSYEKHHSPSNLVIPEDSAQDVKVRVVRQIFGVDSNRLQPIIRLHPETDYRVKFIQIQPLDHYAIHGKKPSTIKQRNHSGGRGINQGIGRANQANNLRRSLQNTKERIFHSQNKLDNFASQQDEEVADFNDFEDDQRVKIQAPSFPNSLLSPPASDMMRLEDQRATTIKKIPQKVKKIEQRQDGQQFTDLQITEKDRQRSSEIGISQKHRRLQTSDLQKFFNADKPEQTSLVIESTENDRIFAQQRRARSSLSNRGSQSATHESGPAVDPIPQEPIQLASSNLLAQYATTHQTHPQRLTIHPDLAKFKNQRHISESLEDQRLNQRKKNRESEIELEDSKNESGFVFRIPPQSNNRATTLQNSIDMQQQSVPAPQKGAAPITDVRAKRQSGIEETRQSLNNVQTMMQQNKVKEKPNFNTQVNQQIVLQQFMNSQLDGRSQVIANGSRSSKNQLSQGLIAPSQKMSKRKAGNSQGQKKQATTLFQQAQSPAQAILTNEQMAFMIQQKREKLNQSQLVSSSNRGLDSFDTNFRKTPTPQQADLAKQYARQQNKQPQVKSQLEKNKLIQTQLIFYDSATQLPTTQVQNSLQINQQNRKSSIEAKLGQQGLVDGAAVIDAFVKQRDSMNKKKQKGSN